MKENQIACERPTAKMHLEYFRNIKQQPPAFKPKTGFKEFDSKLGGGIPPGLSVIGAVCGLGKTSFCLQWGDQTAYNGNDVIFSSLEMQEIKLTARSLSRHTYLNNGFKKTNGRFIAKNPSEISNSEEHLLFSPKEQEAFDKAINDYDSYSDRIEIYGSTYKDRKIDAHIIRDIIEAHIKNTNRKPVVFVDYLQKISLVDSRLSDKQKVDQNISALKAISDEYEIPIVCISSFNRPSYEEPVSLSSFKESGNIEYDADFIMALQYNGIDYSDADSTEFKRKSRVKKILQKIKSNEDVTKPIEIQLKMLKNREGRSFDIVFNMISEYCCFEELVTERQEKTTNDNDDDGILYVPSKKRRH